MANRRRLCGLLLLLTCPAAWAQDPVGAEFQVNTVTRLDQRRSAVASDANGNFVVVWSSYEQDGDSYGVFGQRFNASGLRQGSEFQVNSYITGRQSYPAVALDAAGRMVVVWRSLGQDGSHYGVFARRYDAAGTPDGEFRVNAYTNGFQGHATVAFDATGDGSFLVVWNSEGQDGDAFGVFGRHYDASGMPQGGEFQVNSYTTGYQVGAALAASADGSFVVAWTSANDDGSTYDVFGQRYDTSGTPQGGEFRVNSYTTGNQLEPAAAAAANGTFVVVWRSLGSDWDVFGQRFDAAGTPQGSEFQVNSFTTSQQYDPSVASAANGDFVVAWESFGRDGSSYGVAGRRFAASGLAQGSEFLVNSFTTGLQTEAAVASAANGNFVVVWTSSGQDGYLEGVFGQQFGDLIFENGFE